MATSKKEAEDWMNKKWRPMMGWSYMVACMADFVIFPICWSIFQAVAHGTVSSQWNPITLQGAGLYHLAMGAVLGVAAYGRTQEKLNNFTGGGMQSRNRGGNTQYDNSSSMNNNMDDGNNYNSYGSSTSSMGSSPASGKSAKFASNNPDSVFDRG